MRNRKVVHEEHRRSVLKTISWRIVATSTTMFLVYIVTGHLELTATVGIGDVVLKMFFYFLHERAWNRIAFGRDLNIPIEPAIRSPPVTVLPSDTVSNVNQKMSTSDIGAIIVADANKPYGLITKKDIIERVLNIGRDLLKPLRRI